MAERLLGFALLLLAACSGEVQNNGPGPGAAGSVGSFCATGQQACPSGCAYLMSDAANCGECGRACATGQMCSAGACVSAGCPGGVMACGGCIDVTSDEANCGSCGNVCQGGRQCFASACVCAPDQMDCSGTCVSTQTDAQHCGGCGMACGLGQTCAAGRCACTSGMLCGTTCVDTMTDAANCGGCGMPCPTGQTCAAGGCSGGGLLEDGCSGAAQGASVSRVTVFQGVEVPIMENGQEIAAATRNTDVVVGREALVVVGVTLAQGFTSRELSARLFVENGATSSLYFGKRTIGTSSSDDPESGFQITVPATAIAEGARYAVELAECGGTPSGGAQSPRYPAQGSIALGARTTGTLKVQVIPVRANNRLPTVTENALAVYHDAMLATYPVSEVILSVGDALDTGYPLDWTGLLDEIRAKRLEDDAPDDVYYYGLVAPEETFREFCNFSCTAGVGFVPFGGFGGTDPSARAAVGVGWADEESAMTMVHEVGHNHGRGHAPCVEGGTIEGVDQDYPYEGGLLGIYGYDRRSGDFIDPDRGTDVMGYCQNKWPSDYTYDGFLDTVLDVNSAQSIIVQPGALATWQVMLVDERGPRWGVPVDEPRLPFGETEQAEILDATGSVIQLVTVHRTAISDIDAFSILVPSPEPDWAAIHVLGAPVLAFASASPAR